MSHTVEPKTFPLFEELAGQLRVEADHVIAGEWQRGGTGANRLPKNRIFCIIGPKKAGHISCVNNAIDMHAGHCYHMPPHVHLEFYFAPGLRMLAFHYDCSLGNHFDLCAGIKKISKATCDPKAIQDIIKNLEHLQHRRDLVHIQGRLMQLAAQFVPDNMRSLREQHRMQQRYQVVIDEIDISAAETRIAVIADLMGLSVDQLSKRFRRDIGMPLKHYIDHSIVKRAAEYLRHSDSRIKDISEQLHFRDEFTFSRFFRKHLHTSPSNYRSLTDLEFI